MTEALLRGPDLMRAIAKRIDDNPGCYDQTTWWVACATMGCIAGHAVDIVRKKERLPPCGVLGQIVNTQEEGMRLLDLRGWQMTWLFNSSWEPRDNMPVGDKLRWLADDYRGATSSYVGPAWKRAMDIYEARVLPADYFLHLQQVGGNHEEAMKLTKKLGSMLTFGARLDRAFIDDHGPEAYIPIIGALGGRRTSLLEDRGAEVLQAQGRVLVRARDADEVRMLTAHFENLARRFEDPLDARTRRSQEHKIYARAPSEQGAAQLSRSKRNLKKGS